MTGALGAAILACRQLQHGRRAGIAGTIGRLVRYNSMRFNGVIWLVQAYYC